MATLKGGPSGAIDNDVCKGVVCEADVMTQRDPQVSVNLYFVCTSISI